jgi:hypothetical protein
MMDDWPVCHGWELLPVFVLLLQAQAGLVNAEVCHRDIGDTNHTLLSETDKAAMIFHSIEHREELMLVD